MKTIHMALFCMCIYIIADDPECGADSFTDSCVNNGQGCTNDCLDTAASDTLILKGE